MKVGLLGTGFGIAHAAIYAARPDVEEVVVFGRTPAKLGKFAEQFRFATTTEIDEIYRDRAIELIEAALQRLERRLQTGRQHTEDGSSTARSLPAAVKRDRRLLAGVGEGMRPPRAIHHDCRALTFCRECVSAKRQRNVSGPWSA